MRVWLLVLFYVLYCFGEQSLTVNKVDIPQSGVADVVLIESDPSGAIYFTSQQGSGLNTIQKVEGTTVIWQRNISATISLSVTRMVYFNESIYVMGEYRGGFNLSTPPNVISTDIFIVKVNAQSGLIQWVNLLEGKENDFAGDIISTSDNNLIITGLFLSNIAFGNTTLNTTGFYSNVFIGKLNLDGDWVWVKQSFAQSGTMKTAYLSSTPHGIYVLGLIRGNYIFGDYAVTSPSSGYTLYTAKLDIGTGDFGLALDLGSATSIDYIGVSKIAHDLIAVTGSCSGECSFQGFISSTSSVFAIGIDPNGTITWAHFLQGANVNLPYSAFATPDNIYLLGSFVGAVRFDRFIFSSQDLNPNAYVVILATNGTAIGAVTFEPLTQSSIKATNLIVKEDNIVVAGTFNNTVQFGEQSVTISPRALFVATLKFCSCENGLCIDPTAECLCFHGFAGPTCSLTCPLNCSGNGACTEVGGSPMCRCFSGYKGSSCAETVTDGGATDGPSDGVSDGASDGCDCDVCSKLSSWLSLVC